METGTLNDPYTVNMTPEQQAAQIEAAETARTQPPIRSWLIDVGYGCWYVNTATWTDRRGNELEDVVIAAPPIAYYMKRDHWPIDRVKHFVARKQGTITELDHDEIGQ